MNKGDLGRRLRRVPVLGSILGFFGMLGDVYETIGWTDPGYHSTRSPEERLEEARRVGSIGNRPGAGSGPGDSQVDLPVEARPGETGDIPGGAAGLGNGPDSIGP